MKIHDFGLWFDCGGRPTTKEWSACIPPMPNYSIWYDGLVLGAQGPDYSLVILDEKRYIIYLRNEFYREEGRFGQDYQVYHIGRPLALEDFEIRENPDYRGAR